MCVLSTLVNFSSNAEMLGDVNQSKILPGYITFDQTDPFYKNQRTKNKRNDLIERRTPSAIIKSYFTNEKIDLKKIELEIQKIKDF